MVLSLHESKATNAKMKPNRLLYEKSPYLLQHAYNPVDWYAWGEEAFERARKENKPILLSIGYSTCHWCHVMEKESFSNPEIAAIMNQYLVSIKLDREEHPEIDKIYMTAVTAMTGSGGWPLNVFLTPDLKPFFGGTYFPPEDRWGRIGWPELVKRIGQIWQDTERRKKILESADNLTTQLKNVLSGEELSSNPRPDPLFIKEREDSLLETGFEAFRMDYDSTFGGFGSAPKFPMPVNHNFLLRYYDFFKNKDAEKARKALEISLNTLRAMAKGGIYDQLGGGFHRYSTDEQWRLPHFEKMLYDNAQLAVNYLEAFQITQDEFFAQIAKETLEYVLRELTHPEGGFYSAEDADSLPPELAGKVEDTGHEHRSEGAFYIWSKKEILDALGKEDGEIFCAVYGIEENGNVRTDPHGEFEGKNVLFVASSISPPLKGGGIEKNLEKSRKKLFEIRRLRPRPHLDDKILTSWNGLMISAFARGYQILKDEKYLAASRNAGNFIRKNLYDSKTRQLFRRWRDGEKKISAIADDYAFLVQGLIDLYEASFELSWLEWAVELTEEQNSKFYDGERGGFYMTPHQPISKSLKDIPAGEGQAQGANTKFLIARVKEDSDNVEPSASSIAALNLLRLAEFTNRHDFKKMAEKTLQLFTPQMENVPRSLPQMFAVLSFYLSKPTQMIFVRAESEISSFLTEVHRRFIPNKIMILLGDSVSRKFFTKVLPFTEGMVPLEGKPTAYVCVDYACKLPTNVPKVLSRILDAP